MSEEINLTKQQLEDGCKKCIDNVQNLLDSAKLLLLLNNKNSHQYALGLYVYAIEEYGKAEILKARFIDNTGEYSIPLWVFGKGKYARTGHARKLSKGFQKLPADCTKLSKRVKKKLLHIVLI